MKRLAVVIALVAMAAVESPRLAATAPVNAFDPITFSLGQSIPVGLVFGVTTADFNNDGHLDLAATNSVFSGLGVRVFLGAGDGTFGSGTFFPTGDCATPVTAGDLNRDGNVDLLVGNYCSGSPTLVVWWGDGTGNFTTRSTYSIPGGAQAVAIGDFNGDDWPDIATNSSNGTPSILTGYLNNGVGGFSNRFDLVISTNPFCWGHGMVSRDFNEDGLDDIAVTAGYDGTAVFLAKATGGFDPAVRYPYGTYGVNGLAAADFNHDGHVDLISQVFTMLGAGDGTFTLAPGATVGSNEVEVGDFNGDGNDDIVVAHEYTARVDGAIGRGDGTFEAPSGTAVSATMIESIVGDFNEDGRPDVAVTVGRSSVQILLNTTPPFDVSPPVISCDSADGLWHPTDVTLTCTAHDAGAGLADPSDASFTLSTSVPAGNETAGASTGSRTVCDALGNCATAGPIGGNKVDKRAPTVTISSPGAVTYTLGQLATTAYTCADGGAGIASCAGTTPNGSPLGTSAPGAFAYSVVGTDGVGHQTTRSVNYLVAYRICVLSDEDVAHKAGSTVPIKLTLCDVNGTNVSSESIALVATEVVQLSTSAPGPLQDSGNANPDLEFRFSQDKYVFNLSLKGYTQGTYGFIFRAAGDPTDHLVRFQVK